LVFFFFTMLLLFNKWISYLIISHKLHEYISKETYNYFSLRKTKIFISGPSLLHFFFLKRNLVHNGDIQWDYSHLLNSNIVPYKIKLWIHSEGAIIAYSPIQWELSNNNTSKRYNSRDLSGLAIAEDWEQCCTFVKTENESRRIILTCHTKTRMCNIFIIYKLNELSQQVNIFLNSNQRRMECLWCSTSHYLE